MKIELAGGHTIQLTEIFQLHTYGGLLEGIPTTRLNRMLIDSALAKAAELWSYSAAPHLIEPEESPIAWEGKYPFGTPASIPGVTCHGLWSESNVMNGEEYGDYSLPIVWYQPAFAMPIDESVVAQISKINWRSCAVFHQS